MNFEEYKKHFELFSKIDTPEKLAICESQYQQELLRLEDSNYFEPLEVKSESGILGEYDKGLQEIFELDKIEQKQYYFLILPSFDTEKLLVFKQTEVGYTVTLVTLAEQYWAILYKKKPMVPDKEVSTAEIDVNLGNKIFELLQKVLLEAREPKAKGFVLDGTVYQLTGLIGNKHITVSKHSPREGSKSAKVVSVMEQIFGHINGLSSAVAKEIEQEIGSLLV